MVYIKQDNVFYT